TTAYVLRLVQPWYGSGRTVVGDSWFGFPKLCIALMQNGLYSIFHVKKRRGWPLNYPGDMVQRLGSTYGSYVSKVANIDNVYLMAASLKDRKPQCIVATVSTTTKSDEVKRVVKECTNSSVVKFTRPKVFYEYSCSKGAVDINNQVRDNMTSFHDVMRESSWEMRVYAFLLGVAEANAFLIYKKWGSEMHNISHFDFRRLLADEMLSEIFSDSEVVLPNT
ncbi:16696_t:CDS:2, partial [Dentiscutata heterogama]